MTQQYQNLKQRLEKPRPTVIDNITEHFHPHNVRGEIPEINTAGKLEFVFGLHNKPQRIICLATAYEMLLEEELNYETNIQELNAARQFLQNGIELLYRSLNEYVDIDLIIFASGLDNLTYQINNYVFDDPRIRVAHEITRSLENLILAKRSDMEMWINIGRVAVALEEFYPDDPDRSDKYKDKFYQEFYKRVACRLAFVDAQTAELK